MKNYFTEIEEHAAFARCGVKIITHPKKAGYAKVLTAYPKDGSGRMSVYVVDCFGDMCTTQRGQAGGYGYDKFTAALSGLTIDGHVLSDHSSHDVIADKLLNKYGRTILAGKGTKAIEASIRAKGYNLTNWSTLGGYQPNMWKGYQSCYKQPALGYLSALGYKIINVI